MNDIEENVATIPPRNLSDNAAGKFDDPRVIEALEEYRAALEAGLNPDRHQFQERYPEIAEALASCLAALEFVHSAAPSLSQAGADRPQESQDFPFAAPLGDFRILREVGRGGMGVVYEAEQITLGRRVALKVLPFASTLDAKHLQRFKNEAQAAAQLQHQNIVPVYATGCERGVHYYAMQFIEGQTLAAMIRELRRQTGLSTADQAGAPSPAGSLANELASGRWGPAPRKAPETQPANPDAPAAETIPLTAAAATERSTRSAAYFRTVANLGLQAAQALEHAHQLGVVHRDIKPANLLVDVRGNLWITDFGLAQAKSQVGLTLTGDLVGTLRYMSPEQALAKRAFLDHRTDVYSLGVTLYELLTLQPAFGGNDRQELLRQIAFEEPRLPRRLNSAIPPELETIVLKAMEKSPAERYATAQELAEDLQRFLLNRPILARRARQWERAWRWCRRNPAVAGLLTAAMALATGLAILALLLWDRQRQMEAALKQAEDQRQVAETRKEIAEANFQQACVLLINYPREHQLKWLHDQGPGKAEAFDKALTLYKSFCKEPGPDPAERLLAAQAHIQLALIQHGLGKKAEAAQGFQNAIALLQRLAAQFPKEAGFRNKLAWCYIQLGWSLPNSLDNIEEVEKAFEQSIALNETLRNESPDIPYYTHDLAYAWSNLGQLRRGVGRFQQGEESHRRALALFQQLFEQRPGHHEQKHDLAQSHNSLAWLLVIRPDREPRHAAEALEHAQKAVMLEPWHHDWWHTLGVAHCRLGHWKEALAAIEKSRQLEYNPGPPGSFDRFFEAMAYSGLGDLEKARRCYDEGVQWREKHFPDHADLRRFQAEAAEMLKMLDANNLHKDPKDTKNKP